jgi:hypothetical protein
MIVLPARQLVNCPLVPRRARNGYNNFGKVSWGGLAGPFSGDNLMAEMLLILGLGALTFVLLRWALPGGG